VGRWQFGPGSCARSRRSRASSIRTTG
jgi:hypothetical protein